MEKVLSIIDRFEEEWAVIEYGKKTFSIPLALLNAKVLEGDVINIKIEVDKLETEKRKKLIDKLRKKYLNKNKDLPINQFN